MATGQTPLTIAQKGDKGTKDTPYRAVYNAEHTFNEDTLPGKLVRAEGEKAVKDKAVNEAYDNVGTVLEFYKEHFNWKSIDNDNMDVISSVHFGSGYENACEYSKSQPCHSQLRELTLRPP
jgi:Zn-dependent metalloprotease